MFVVYVVVVVLTIVLIILLWVNSSACVVALNNGMSFQHGKPEKTVS